MPKANLEVNNKVLLEIVTSFASNTSGLALSILGDSVQIVQKADDKKLTFLTTELSDVLTREDKEGKTFIQVNFKTGRKILLTDSLVGFKPESRVGLDLNRLPKVVTTPDLLSVFEAIEEILNSDTPNDQEVEVLREVYYSILCGGENVGFDLQSEKIWLSRLMTSKKASA